MSYKPIDPESKIKELKGHLISRITQAIVILNQTFDTITLYIDLNPNYLEQKITILSFNVEAGKGIEYIVNAFGITPTEIIDSRPKKSFMQEDVKFDKQDWLFEKG